MQTFMRLVLAAFVGVLVAAPAAAQSSDALFDDAILHEVRVRMNSRDLQRLRQSVESNTFYVADFIWQGTRVRNVAVRSRGGGSRHPQKLGLLVDFDRYVAGRRFAGQASLVLDNLWQDAALLREKLSMAMFERMGDPAPRVAFARVYINDVYEGVYSIVETIEEPMLARSLGEDAGYLFEYHWVRPFRASFPGPNVDEYKPMFEPRTRTHDGDALIYGPLVEMFRQISEPFDDLWRERVEALVDVPAFIRQAAIESFIAEDDGLLGYDGMNNFYLYRMAGSNRHRSLPWDKDNAFHTLEQSVVQRLDENVLFDRLMQFDDLADLYYDTILEAAERAGDEQWLLTEVERLADMIRPAVAEDTHKQFSTEAFEDGIDFLRQFAMTRGAFVRAQIAELRDRR